MDTVALYKRILLLVDPPVLHRTSNVVLQEEYTAVFTSMNDMAASFAKVEEVRDAVNQLEQNKASAGRSKSLMIVMDSILQSQQKLHHKLQQMAIGMKVVDLKVKQDEKKEKKRKKVEKNDEKIKAAFNDPSLSSSNTDVEYEDEKDVKNEVKKQKCVERVAATGIDKTKSADLSLATEALDALSKIKAVSKVFHSDTELVWLKILNDLKLVLKHQSRRDAHSTDNSAAEATARALDIVVMVFQRLAWTPERSMEVRSLVAALSDACARNEVLKIFFYQVRSQLESFGANIPNSAKTFTGKVTLADPESAKALNNQLQTFQGLVVKVQASPKSDSMEHIIKALEVLQQVMANDAACSHHVRVQHSAENVRCWISERPYRSDLSRRYEGFAQKLAKYGSKLYGCSKQVEIQRLATNLLRLLDEQKKQFSNNSQTSKMVPIKTKKMQDRLECILAQVEQWQDGIFSMNQLEKAIQSFGEVASYKSKHWDPLADLNVRLCVNKLIRCAQMTKKPTIRAKYMKTVNKWKTKIDEH